MARLMTAAALTRERHYTQHFFLDPEGRAHTFPTIAGGAMARPRDPLQLAAMRTQMRESPEDIYQPQWDRVNYAAAGVATVAFFTIPKGQNATLIRAGAAATVTKTFRDTNLEQPGVVPSKALSVRGFSVSFVPLQQAIAGAATPSIPDDVQRLTYGGFLTLTLLDKPYLRLPLILLPSTGVLRGLAATTANATTMISAPGSGSGNPRDSFWTGVPLTIDPYQTFNAEMGFDGTVALTQTFDIYLFLHCYVRRPGQ